MEHASRVVVQNWDGVVAGFLEVIDSKQIQVGGAGRDRTDEYGFCRSYGICRFYCCFSAEEDKSPHDPMHAQGARGTVQALMQAIAATGN